MDIANDNIRHPKVSVVMPAYNVEQFIQETIGSLLAQSFKDFELIVVDDGSSDSTPKILKSLADSDTRITIISQPNKGPGAARNTGLDVSSGEYVMFLDSDDLYESSLLEKLVEAADVNKAEVVACRSTQFDGDTGAPIESWWTIKNAQLPKKEVFCKNDMPDFLFSAFIGWPWDKFYKRTFIESYGLRFPNLSNSEDLYFVFLSLVKASTICVVSQPLIKHRVRKHGSVSSSRAAHPLDFYESTCQLKRELRKDPEAYAVISWSFLNWAFGYMIWNIETMNDIAAQRTQLAALANNEFPELEISLHSPAFFSLDPSAYPRYLALLNQAVNANDHPKATSALKRRAIKLINRIKYRGIIDTLVFTFGWLQRRFFHNIVKDTDLSPRGSDFAKTAPHRDDLRC